MGTRLKVALAGLRDANTSIAALRKELAASKQESRELEKRLAATPVREAPYGRGNGVTSLLTAREQHTLNLARRKYALRAGSGLDPGTLASYKAVFKRYFEFCGHRGFPDPRTALHTEALVAFLWTECKRVGNAASWGQWRSAVVSYATKRLGLHGLDREGSDFMFDMQKACARTVGITTKATDPLDNDAIVALYERGRPTVANGLRRRLIWLQLVIMKAMTTRPGEVMDYSKPLIVAGHKVANNSKVLRAKDVTFVPPDKRMPHGALGLRLRCTKGMKLRGALRSEGERAYAVGTGDAFCAVAAMKEFFSLYGLYERPEEVVFASMREDGSRKFRQPTLWLGASPMKGPEFNEGLRLLCADAGLPRFTARATRYGAVCDSEAWGVPASVIDAQGRWRPGSRFSYSSFTFEGARAIYRARQQALSRPPVSSTR